MGNSAEDWKRVPTALSALFAVELPYRPPESVLGALLWRWRLFSIWWRLSRGWSWCRGLWSVLCRYCLGRDSTSREAGSSGLGRSTIFPRIPEGVSRGKLCTVVDGQGLDQRPCSTSKQMRPHSNGTTSKMLPARPERRRTSAGHTRHVRLVAQIIDAHDTASGARRTEMVVSKVVKL